MLSYLIESVTLAFVVGGFVGAIVAYQFSYSRCKAQISVDAKAPR